MAPTCRFDPQQMSVWSNQTGVRFFESDVQRDEAYLRARPFLLEQMRILLNNGWKHSRRSGSDEVLLHIYRPWTKKTRGYQPRGKNLNDLILPNTFNQFFDTSKAKTWRTIFENPAIFKAQRKKGNKQDVHIGLSRPLANVFYLLQVLAPGMLVIYNEYQLPNANVKSSRVLPRASWIQESYHMLNIEVMGSMVALLAAAENQTIAFREERTTRPRENQTTAFREKRMTRPRYSSHRDSEYTIIRGDCPSRVMEPGELYDWTVCDKDCGWCGRCQLV